MARNRRLPAFPSTCKIFRGGPPGTGVQVYNGPCEKRLSVNVPPFVSTAPPLTLYSLWVAIYLPPHTDVRGQGFAGGKDLIQWASNANWLYVVEQVDDVAADFPNMFRIAWCLQFSLPTPIP
jgi:hypothetical protein